jgi:hypothetical protein
MLPAVGAQMEPSSSGSVQVLWLGEKSGTTLLVVRQEACEARTQ